MKKEIYPCLYCGRNSSCKVNQKYCEKCQNFLDLYPPKNHTAMRMIRNRDFVMKCKEGKKCVQCSYNKNSQILEFHHLDKHSKTEDVSKLMRSLKSIEMIKSEINKCILLCPNCHRELHLMEKYGK